MALESSLLATLTVSEAGAVSVVGSKEEKATDANELMRRVISLADGAVDQLVEFGAITSAKKIFISADQELGIKLDGVGNTPISCRLFAISTDGVTSIHLSNSSGAAATVTIVLTD